MIVDVVEELGNETLIYGDVAGEVAAVEIDATLPAPLPGARARVCARLSGFTAVRPRREGAAGAAPRPRAPLRGGGRRGARGRLAAAAV